MFILGLQGPVGPFGGYLGFFESHFILKSPALSAKALVFGLLLIKKMFFETLLERWLPAGVFHRLFGGYGGPMLGHLGGYKNVFLGLRRRLKRHFRYDAHAGLCGGFLGFFSGYFMPKI